MDLLINTIINTYSILLLVVIYLQSLKKGKKTTLQHQLYILMIQVTIILLFFDILGRFDGNPDTVYHLFNKVGNFLIFLLQPTLPSLWFLYVYYQVSNSKEKIKRAYFPLLLWNLANASLVFASQYTGRYYYIDAANIYHRGPLFILSNIFTLGLLLATSVAKTTR